MIQLPGSTLPADVLKLGFNKMNNWRLLWLKDCEAGLFKFVKHGQDGDGERNSGVDPLNEVANTQEPNENDGSDLDDGYEEWTGFGDLNLDGLND